MSRRPLLPVLVSAALLLCGCAQGGPVEETETGTEARTGTETAAASGTEPDAEIDTATETDGAGQEVAHAGRLVGVTVIGIHQIDLPAGSAQAVLGEADFRAGHTAAMQVGEPVLHTAHLPLRPEPLTVRSYRLDGAQQDAGPVVECSWPHTELANRVHALAVSPDGTHFAAVIADGPSTYLEVVDRESGDVVFSGRDRADRTLGLVGKDLLWSQEHGLVYVAELGG